MCDEARITSKSDIKITDASDRRIKEHHLAILKIDPQGFIVGFGAIQHFWLSNSLWFEYKITKKTQFTQKLSHTTIRRIFSKKKIRILLICHRVHRP